MNSIPKFSAVLFDCDGVLVDSETITNSTLRAMLGELGWHLSAAECLKRFAGCTLRDQADTIELHSGFRITEEWLNQFRVRRNRGLRSALEAIPGSLSAVAEIQDLYKGRIACASAADRDKIELQLRHVGLSQFFEDRIFSGLEVPRSKPAPDVYLAAAAYLGANPADVVIVEDSVPGVIAGAAAGAHVLGYCPGGEAHRPAEELLAVGADEIFTSMSELPTLVSLPSVGT